jgi:O-antigen/teichoic acid export membrane protein
LSNLKEHTKTFLEKARQKFLGTGSTGDIFKNMGILASGVGIGKAIGFLSMPIITRIYTPEDFGVLAVFTTAILLIVPLSTLLYSITIPLPKTDGIAVNIVFLCSVLIVFITGMLTMLFALFGDSIFGFFNMEEIAAYWWVLIIGIFAASFYELMTHWATRVKAFTEVAKTKIWQASISAVLKIGLGLLGFKPLGLLIGDVSQRGGGVVSLVKAFFKKLRDNLKYVRYNRVKFLLRYYVDLPIYRLPSQFLFKLSSQIPILFFAFQFGREPTGHLGLSLSMIALPMSLLGTTTGKAYYAEIAKIGEKKKEEILSITKKVTKRLFVLSILPTFILIFAAPLLFQIIFGAEWKQAGVFTSILAFYLLIQFITSPLVNVFTVFNLQRKFLEINIVRSMLMVAVFGISYLYSINVYNTLILYTIIISLHYIFTGYQVFKVIK